MVDVYLYFHRQNDDFKESIKDLYDEIWNMDFIMETAKEPNEYIKKLKSLNNQLTEELGIISGQPSVGDNEFEICPKRNALLALQLVEHDIKTLTH